MLLEHDYIDVKSKDGKLLYRIKECIDDFPYSYTDAQGRRKTVKLTEKRIVTYNPKLAEKQNAKIIKQVEKSEKLKASEMKRSDTETAPNMLRFLLRIKKVKKRMERSRWK